MRKLLISLISLAALAASALATAHAHEVVVGVPVSSSGIFAFANLPARNGIELAAEEVARSGELGDATLKLLIEDTASDKNQAVNLVHRFINTNNAVLILGPTSTVEAQAYLPIAQSRKIPALTQASGDVAPIGEWIFKANAAPAKIVESLALRYARDYQPKRAAYIFNRDNESYLQQKDGIKRPLEQAGVKTVIEETIVGSDTDFSAIVTKVVARDIDTLVVSTTGEATANIVIQARQAGLPSTVRIVATPSAASHQFVKVGGPAVEGVIFTSDYFIGNQSELNQKFVAAYKKKYGIEPDTFAAIGYSNLKTAAAAVKNAGPDYSPESIRRALAGIRDLPTVLGNGILTQTASRTPIYDGVVLTIRDGKIVQL
ncbi:ABC transporter substrate-binding protein [Pollutimonas bauzanensis]|uniref:Amino acid/amide ABC transporter substrate-binding protein, HAAT family n=1 Tax=Pollutimonas bauzanensis TaxID=658167 RepID=A0A1M5QSL7_9BURK|nr:ABC transporter substrate-binding protein [Pollutimonas bauzanensis]SHH17072.1 amino acid/amide ABC transporter substrate-binding protein, HAAT family [Pollutimonas bauzanensis]